MKILHLAVSVEKRRGGTAQVPLSLCRGLRAAGVDAQVAAVVNPEFADSSRALEYPDVPVHEFPISFPKRFTGSGGLRQWLGAQVKSFDVVEVHEIFAAPPLYGRVACRRAGVPYLLNLHNGLNPRDLRKRRWLKLLFRRPFLIPLIRDAAGIKATSQYELDNMVQYVQPKAVHMLPIPVEAPPPGGDSVAFRAKWGIPANAFVVGCVGRIDGQKALELLIEAFGIFLSSHPDAWLLLAGTGTPEYTGHIRRLLAEHRVESRCTLPGFVSGADKSSAFLAIDFYTQVSWYENFCIAVAEAMAMGCPCLVSDQVGLAPDVLVSGAGFSCRTTVPDVLDGLMKGWAARSEREQMASAAKRYFNNHLTMAATTPKLVRIYEQVLSSAR